MKISPHFHRSEFAQPARHGFKRVPYPEELFPFLRQLCFELEIIRAAFNRPITILSGFRSSAYNKAVGGARNSQHLHGTAADIAISGVSASKVHDTILRLHREGIVKLGGLGRYKTHTHVDIRPGRLRRWSAI